MSTVIIKSIDVDVSVATAFEQWTRFEELPRFVSGLLEVKRLDDRCLHWRAEIAAIETVWQLEITALKTDERIEWVSRLGPKNWGAVMFEPLSRSRTRVRMELHYDPVSFMQYIGDYLGVLGRWVERSLSRFKALVEEPVSICSRLPAAEELIGQ